MVAPRNKNQDCLDSYTNRLFNLKNELNEVDSINKLIDTRRKYLIWYEELKQFLNKNEFFKTLFLFSPDKVFKTFSEGGVGLEWKDKRSQFVLNALENEIKDKIYALEEIVPISQYGKIIQKKGDSFYYYGNLINTKKNTSYYHLLNILLDYSNQDGFVSYKKIVEKMKDLKKLGILSSKVKNITQKTISNSLKDLFIYSKIGEQKFINKTLEGKKLIEPIRGEGLILRNEKMN